MLRPRALLAMTCLASALALSPTADAAPTPGDLGSVALDEAKLERGEAVTYPQTLTRHGKRYIGGVTYAVVNASADELLQLLADLSAYTEVLPYARAAHLVGHENGDRLVEITQGTSLITAAYTLRLRADDDKQQVRFWLDPSRPHGIDDAWGYFRVKALPAAADGSPRVLLAYGILVDLGPGLMRDFFESRIQASMLTVPERLRVYAMNRFRGRHRA